MIAGSESPAATGRLSIVTPASWRRLDLDPRTRDRSLREMVKRALGADDRLARLRHEAVVAYRRVVADAVDRGAFLLAMVSTVVDGTPLFASLQAFLVPGVTAPGDSLAATVAGMGPVLSGPGDHQRVVETGPVELRLGPAHRVRALVGSGVHGRDGGEAAVDVVRFFVPLAGGAHLLVLAFSTPILDLGDVFAELFDQMALSARWLDAA
jgi:hypothetical protein